MNRTLTAAVALSAALGMAGLAHAQSSTSPSTQPNAATSSPGTGMTGPAGTQNPATMGQSPSTMGTTGSSSSMSGPRGPQANMGQGTQATQSEIQQAQQQLKSQGLYRGAVDGVMGPETQTAVMAFQREHSLPQTAQLDQQTLSALNGGGSSTGSQPGGAAGMTPGSSSTGTMNHGTTGGSSSYNR